MHGTARLRQNPGPPHVLPGWAQQCATEGADSETCGLRQQAPHAHAREPPLTTLVPLTRSPAAASPGGETRNCTHPGRPDAGVPRRPRSQEMGSTAPDRVQSPANRCGAQSLAWLERSCGYCRAPGTAPGHCHPGPVFSRFRAPERKNRSVRQGATDSPAKLGRPRPQAGKGAALPTRARLLHSTRLSHPGSSKLPPTLPF